MGPLLDPLNPVAFLKPMGPGVIVPPLSVALRVSGAHLRVIAPGNTAPFEEMMAALCVIRPAHDLNLRPPSPETNALTVNQLADDQNS